MSPVLYSVDHRGVATLTLNRPEKHNAFDDDMIGLIDAALRKADSDDAVRVLVLAAAGRSFSAGADLAWMRRVAAYTYEENVADAKGLASMLHTLNFLSKPTLARVQGNAFGGAVGLISCCDMAVAAEEAQFCLSEVKLGLIPATISPYVISAMGERFARRYFLSAERFSATTAQQCGLVSEVVVSEDLDTWLERWVEAFLANGPVAVKEAKRLLQDVAQRPIDETLIEDTCERIARIRVSPEGQEGLGAFLEKRRPSYDGSSQ
jgi:methylglutaconyl-CoA hydratase